MIRSTRWGTGVMALTLMAGSGCAGFYGMRRPVCADVAMPPVAEIDSVSVGGVAPEGAGAVSGCGAAAEQPATTGRIEQTAAATERLMTYDATLRVVVQNIAGTMESVKAMAVSLKGYLQGMSEHSITVRIPAARLNDAIAQVGKIGEITAKTIEGDDVTEQMMDLDIRLRTTEETRNRLTELLKKTDKVEELLKVEKELQRVVESLELIKGRIKYLSHAVAYSTLTVELNSPVAQTEQREAVPFSWVRCLATDIVLSPDSSFTPVKRWRSWLKMDLPSTFVKVSEYEGRTLAMSGNGVWLMVRRQDNFEDGTPAFWSQIIRRWLVENKVIALAATKDLTLASGANGTEFTGTKAVGRKEYQYMLVMVVNKANIHTVECWGPAEEMAKEREGIDKAIRTMKVKP